MQTKSPNTARESTHTSGSTSTTSPRLIPSLSLNPGSRRSVRRYRRIVRPTAMPCEVSQSRQGPRNVEPLVVESDIHALAMTSAQARLAETIESFYNASDRASDGAMAGHAFKSAVDDLDTSVQREMVCNDLARAGCCLGSEDAIVFDLLFIFRKHHIVRVSWSRSGR